MGFTPQQVDAMSLWQFFAALNGYVEANSPQKRGALSESEKDDIWERMQRDEFQGTLRTQTYWLDGDQLVPWRVVEFVALRDE